MTSETGRERFRWGLSAAVVLAAHAGTAAWVMNRPSAPPPAAPPAAIIIDLAPIAAAPEVPVTELPPLPEQPASEDVPEPPEEEAVEAEPVPEPEPLLEPEPVAEPPPAEPPPEPLPEPVEQPPPPEPPKEKPPSKPSVASAPQPTQQPKAKAAAPVASTAVRPGNAMPTWRSQLAAILERNKRYPSAARSRGEEGTASVRFTINRSGNLMSVTLVRSSGSPALDQEAVALVRRSQPFPPPPAEIRGNSVTIVVPVRFNIR